MSGIHQNPDGDRNRARSQDENSDGSRDAATPARRTSRRQRQLLIASGLVAAVAVTWGGIAATATVTPAGAGALSATDTRATDSGDLGASDQSSQDPGASTPGAPESGTSGTPTPGAPAGSTTSPAPAAGEAPAPGAPSSDPAAGVPAAGHHEGHGGGADTAVRPGAGLPGTPLTGAEPLPPAEQASAVRPGTQQETSLDAAAAQPEAAAPDAAAPGAAGGVDRTQGLTPRGPIDPAEVTSGLAALGGCLPEYGTNGQCLPVVPPSMAEHAQQMADSGLGIDSMDHPWSCTEVRQLFPEGLSVRQAGVDPQNLDTTGDGTACGPDD